MSAKRRRGIGVKKWIIAALKERAEKEGGKSPTQIAVKIWTGKISPLGDDCRRFKSDSLVGSKGVSMRESLWLAIKLYAEDRGKGESYQAVANKILVGKADPVPESCMTRGKEWAEKREEERASEPKPKKPKPKKPKPKKPKKPKTAAEKSKAEEVVEERSFGNRKRKLSEGSLPGPDNQPSEKKLTPDIECLGGVFNL